MRPLGALVRRGAEQPSALGERSYRAAELFFLNPKSCGLNLKNLAWGVWGWEDEQAARGQGSRV